MNMSQRLNVAWTYGRSAAELSEMKEDRGRVYTFRDPCHFRGLGRLPPPLGLGLIGLAMFTGPGISEAGRAYY
jgi:hypothetical protein